ncbi:MAG: hypothetical protein ABI698_08455 [bacterium]
MKKIYQAAAFLSAVLIAGFLVQTNHAQKTEPQKTQHDMEMHERGDKVMGFDHLKTTHHFLLAKDGGVIKVEANEGNDKESRDQIRKHLGHIAKMFSEGNFSAPMLVHSENPPGTAVMKNLKAEIKYNFSETERGALIRISTNNPEARQAVYEFLRYQIREHETGDPLELQ